MGDMFDGCSGLTALDVSHFDTAKVTYMGEMFHNCSGLETLDLSQFDTAKTMNMVYMFNGCSNLKTIFASDKFTVTSAEGGLMFGGCASLVGGNGTEYNGEHIGKEYARIDAADAPGYFTYKAAPVAYAITDTVTENGNLSVTLTNPGAATLAVSYLDANGKFVSAETQSVQANAGTVALALSADAKTARVTLFDGDFRPLCAARPATL